MFKWSAFPFLRISLCLTLGILTFESVSDLWSVNGYMLIGAFVVTALIWFYARHTLLFGAACLLFLCYIGGSLAMLHDQAEADLHYSNMPKVTAFAGTIISDNTERKNYHRYNLALTLGKNDSATFPLKGKIFLYVKKEQEPELLEYGDVITISGSYFGISAPKNPHEFDYRDYLQKQNVFAHAFVNESDIGRIGYAPSSQLRALAYRIRSYAQTQLSSYISYDRERAILTALLLGIKDHLDNDIKSAYAAAGAMHVLAVSGLHVGIIYLALLFLLRPIKDSRWGRLPFVIIVLSVIWIYALVTGFSASVMRASTMFSVIVLSDAFSKKANVYNSLGIASCILIVYDPYIIYSVGFQLSFAAVFGIVKLFPPLYRMLEFNYKVPDYLWKITCVSIAAQIATFPLTLHYFHQFPTYFLISNLLIIPAATVILGAGIVMLLLGSFFPMAGQAIGFYFEKIVWGLNELISLVTELPSPIIDWLYLDTAETLLIYLFLIFLAVGLSRYSFSNLTMSGLFLMVLFGWQHVKTYRQHLEKKVIFYEIDGATAVDLIHGDQAVLLIDSVEREVIGYQVNPNRLASGLSAATEGMQNLSSSDMIYKHAAGKLLAWNGIKILFLDQENENSELPLEADIIYLNQPEEWQLSSINADQIILSTAFKWHEVREIQSAFDGKIDVHSLSEDGFWELDLSKPESRGENEQLLTKM